MREIQANQITETVARLAVEANHYLGEDVVAALKNARAVEESPAGREVFDQLLMNVEIAKQGEFPLCQDTGTAVVVIELGQDAHVGNFVETKKAKLGKGAKANHLTYLGDAEVGAGSNIGAGVITCNYDGVHKHHTHIGQGAFVGSDSTLVAPIAIGDGAYVGAGSCITHDVPSGALAVGRARQITKEGWIAARRARREEKKD